MRITRHGDYLIQLTRFPLLFPINCCLVREDDGFTLIDTGIKGMGQRIVAAARELGAPITRIALTHAHGDHAGSLDELHALIPDAEFLVSARDARFLSGDMSLDAGEPQSKLRGSYITARTQPTRLLEPGDRVGSLEVIGAPGHTPGQIAFLDSRDRSLIVGDAFQTRAGLAVAGKLRPLFPFPALATWHKPTALVTARALRALEPARLAVGHGDVLEKPVPAMERAIAEAEAAFGPELAHVA